MFTQISVIFIGIQRCKPLLITGEFKLLVVKHVKNQRQRQTKGGNAPSAAERSEWAFSNNKVEIHVLQQQILMHILSQ